MRPRYRAIAKAINERDIEILILAIEEYSKNQAAKLIQTKWRNRKNQFLINGKYDYADVYRALSSAMNFKRLKENENRRNGFDVEIKKTSFYFKGTRINCHETRRLPIKNKNVE
jgi:hypothetical protein